MSTISTTPFFRLLTTSVPHSLRVLSVVSFIPAFLFLLIGGIASEKVNPAIGLLPLFFSSAFSVLTLVNDKKCTCSAGGLTGTPLHMMFDMLFGIGLLICLIVGWISMGGWASYTAGWPIILSTYGTTFMLFNFGVHAYFVLQQALNVFKSGSKYSCVCTQAQFQYTALSQASGNVRSRDESGPLLDTKGQPTASVDYEEVV